MLSNWLTAFSLSILSACATLLPACGQPDPAGTNSDDTGSLTLGLATTAEGRSDRLWQASFDVSRVDGVREQARFSAPDAITLDDEGGLFVSDHGLIRRVVLATGEVTTLATSLGPDTLCPIAMVVSSGTLYFSDCDLAIYQIALDTGEVALVAGSPRESGNGDGIGSSARFVDPSGLATDGAGNLYVSDPVACTIRKLVLATREVTTLAGSPDRAGTTDGTGNQARFSFPNGLTFNGDGNLYVADLGAIRKIALASGQVTTLAGGATANEDTADGTGGAARFNVISAINSDDLGNLYVSDFDTLRKVVIATAAVSSIAGRAGDSGYADGVDARFGWPSGIVHVGGQLYVADNDNSVIRRLALDSHLVSTFAGSQRRSSNQDPVLPQ